MTDYKKILVIRRDNIGDLLCTTPLIRGLRNHFPAARIDALVNSYNVPVIERNPDLDNVYAYTKAKHRDRDTQTVIGVTHHRLRLLWSLRCRGYDLVVLANGGAMTRALRLARWIAPKNVLGFYDPRVSGADIINLRVSEPKPRHGHEVETLWSLLAPLGIDSSAPGPLILNADPDIESRARENLQAQPWYEKRPLIAVHISARKPSQRWPAERFVAALTHLRTSCRAQFMLFWSPGDELNPLHPGDDRKAAAILHGLPDGFPVLPWPTSHLSELIGGLSVCDGMLCSDGGAMHIGAAVGLPIACFFGQSLASIWHPWGVPFRVMQPESLDVQDVQVPEVDAALQALWPQIEARCATRQASSCLPGRRSANS